MTTIAAIHVPDKGTWIGSDRQATGSGLKMMDVDKWTRHGPWAVGMAGTMYQMNLVQENAPALLSRLTSPRAFVRRYRKLMLENHVEPIRDDDESVMEFWGHNILLASSEGVWNISAEMICHKIAPNTIWAGGSGLPFALGAGGAVLELTGDPERAIEAAVRFAMKHDACSGGTPFFAHLAPS